MSEKNTLVTLRKGEATTYGATHWSLELKTTCDGRGRGGLMLAIDIFTQSEGLSISGELIPWSEIIQAKAHAEVCLACSHIL